LKLPLIQVRPIAAAAAAVSDDDSDDDFALQNTKPEERLMTSGGFAVQ
jgi:hypothetical protein